MKPSLITLWILFLGILIFGFYSLISKEFKNEQNKLSTSLSKGNVSDTTFVKSLVSNDAVYMDFTIKSKSKDVKKLNEIKRYLHEESLKYDVMFFYESLNDSTISKFTKNCKYDFEIKDIKFDELFLRLIYIQDSINNKQKL